MAIGKARLRTRVVDSKKGSERNIQVSSSSSSSLTCESTISCDTLQTGLTDKMTVSTSRTNRKAVDKVPRTASPPLGPNELHELVHSRDWEQLRLRLGLDEPSYDWGNASFDSEVDLDDDDASAFTIDSELITVSTPGSAPPSRRNSIVSGDDASVTSMRRDDSYKRITSANTRRNDDDASSYSVRSGVSTPGRRPRRRQSMSSTNPEGSTSTPARRRPSFARSSSMNDASNSGSNSQRSLGLDSVDTSDGRSSPAFKERKKKKKKGLVGMVLGLSKKKKKVSKEPIDTSLFTTKDENGATPLHLILLRYTDGSLGQQYAPEDIILGFINIGAVALRIANQDGMLPLHLAAREGHGHAVIIRLLELYPKAIERTDSTGKGAHGHAFDYVAESQAPLPTVHDGSEDRKRMDAENENRWAIVKLLLHSHASFENPDPSESQTPLLVRALTSAAPASIVSLLISPSEPLFSSEQGLPFSCSSLYLSIARLYPLPLLESLVPICAPKAEEVRDQTGMGLVAAHFIVWCYERAEDGEWRRISKNLDMIERFINSPSGRLDNSFREWWAKMKFWIRFCRRDERRSMSSGSDSSEEAQHDEYLLHAALSNPDTPPVIVQLLLTFLPRSASLSQPSSGALPLHIAASTLVYTPRNYETPSSESATRLVLNAYPEAAGKKWDGKLPLHLAISVGETSSLAALIDAEKRALRVRDEATKLYPFQMMSVKRVYTNDEMVRFTHIARNLHSNREWTALSTTEKRDELKKVRSEHEQDRLGAAFAMLRSEPTLVKSGIVHKKSVDRIRDETGMGMVAAQYMVWCYGGGRGGWKTKQTAEKMAVIESVIKKGSLSGAPTDFVKWWSKMKFWIGYCHQGGVGLAQKDAKNDPPSDDPLLHAALANPDTPPLIVHLILSLNPSSASLPQTSTGSLPLHVASSTPSYTPRKFEVPCSVSPIELLIRAHPDHVMRKHEGRLPLHLAISSGKTWQEMEPLVLAKKRSLRVRDAATNLYPFQMMAVRCIYKKEDRVRFFHRGRNKHTHVEWMRMSPRARMQAYRWAKVDHELEMLRNVFELLRCDPILVESGIARPENGGELLAAYGGCVRISSEGDEVPENIEELRRFNDGLKEKNIKLKQENAALKGFFHRQQKDGKGSGLMDIDLEKMAGDEMDDEKADAVVATEKNLDILKKKQRKRELLLKYKLRNLHSVGSGSESDAQGASPRANVAPSQSRSLSPTESNDETRSKLHQELRARQGERAPATLLCDKSASFAEGGKGSTPFKESTLNALHRGIKQVAESGNDAAHGSTKNQTTGGESPTPNLKEDPEYAKYFKMLKVGVPRRNVMSAVQRDGKDPAVLARYLDASSVETKLNAKEKNDEPAPKQNHNGPPLREDPDFAKYFKMLKVGLPKEAVKNALQKDGKDPAILDLDPDKSMKSQMAQKDDGDEPPLRDDPEYAKYFKMLKVGLPREAVMNALQRDGKDPGILDLDPEKSVKSQTAEKAEDDGPALKDDPEFAKYFKMLKVGLPREAVMNALQRDGKDPGILDLDPDKSVQSQTAEKAGDEGPALKDDPEFAKYFKMLKVGLPRQAVMNALQRDGKDPNIMDLDPEKSVRFQMGSKSKQFTRKAQEQKRNVRRKKIFWNPIDQSRIDGESVWSLVRGSVSMDTLEYDTTEFENLFTDKSDPTQKKKVKSVGRDEASKTKQKAVHVIDGKRSMNGGIILARIKIDFATLAKMVDTMDSGSLDVTQLLALKQFLPDEEETAALKAFSGSATEESIKNLSSCEKYMMSMMNVANSASKFDCMLFKVQFRTRISELMDEINTMTKACDEVRTSKKMRKLLAMILMLGNHINTGGSGDAAAGFSLDALLKLDEAKAFDKKTSVLQYLVKLVKHNDESLLQFNHEIESVAATQGIMLDGLINDIKTLNCDLENTKKTVNEEAKELDGIAEEMHSETRQGDDMRREWLAFADMFQSNAGCEEDWISEVDYKHAATPMENFIVIADAVLEKTLCRVHELKEKYSKVLRFFGEDPTMPSHEFFGTIKKFVVAFGSALEVVERAEKAKMREAKRARRKSKSKELTTIHSGRELEPVDIIMSDKALEVVKKTAVGKLLQAKVLVAQNAKKQEDSATNQVEK